MSASLTPSKRQNDGNVSEPDGKGKLQKSNGSFSQNKPLKSSPSCSEFRVLCPSSKTDSAIGKDGLIISKIREETGATVGVKETIPGCDEVVITICFDKENEAPTEQSKEGDGKEENVDEKHDETKEKGENADDKESVAIENSKSENVVPSASLQMALMLFFDKMIEGKTDTDGGDGERKKSSIMVLRLLVLSTQVGCILGKGGSVIKQMALESGAQIRILPRDKLPPCASVVDELVQITGEVHAVRKALQAISLQLLGIRGRESFPANRTGPSSQSQGQPHPRPEAFPSVTAPPLIPKFHEGGIHGRMRPSQEILTFRLLCHADRVGGIIGKGGTIIKTVQQDTGCEIKVMEGTSDSEDRVIVVSGPVHPNDRISAVQDAVLRVQNRIVWAVPDSKEQSVTARLLVSSSQIGCLLGKGGSVIAEMRKLSRAHIRVLGKDQIPKCASEDEEVVQINGEFEAVQDALVQITTRLQHHFFRDAFPSMNYPSPAFLDPPPFLPFLGRREPSPPGMYPHFGPPFHKFNDIGVLPPHGGFHPHDDRPPFMHGIHRFGGPTHISERRHWGPQGFLEGGGPGLPDFAEVPQRRAPGFVGGNQPPIISSTTVEVVVPRSVVPAIYGEDGECLKQIRQISDAKITITEPKPGAVETVIIIAGTPEQTNAAQSLIQAFVMSETEST